VQKRSTTLRKKNRSKTAAAVLSIQINERKKSASFGTSRIGHGKSGLKLANSRGRVHIRTTTFVIGRFDDKSSAINRKATRIGHKSQDATTRYYITPSTLSFHPPSLQCVNEDDVKNVNAANNISSDCVHHVSSAAASIRPPRLRDYTMIDDERRGNMIS